jgi:hypothetical protein
MATINAKVVRILPNWWPYTATTIYPFILVRQNYKRSEPSHTMLMRHECIHLFQQRELLVIFAIPYYVLELWIRTFLMWSRHKAYYTHSMEVESYQNQDDVEYINLRKPFAWLKFVLTKNLYNLPMRKSDFDARCLPPLIVTEDFEEQGISFVVGDDYDPFQFDFMTMARLYAHNKIARKGSPKG